MNNTEIKELENDKVIIRKFEISDVNMIFENWACDPIVTKYLTWDAHKSLEDTYEILNEWIMSYNDSDTYNWGIVNKDTNELIGSIRAGDRDEFNKTYEVGYCISKKCWGLGLTSSALDLVLDFLFKDVEVEFVTSRHDVRNINSGKVMIKSGMKYTKRIDNFEIINKESIDCKFYEITKEDYFNK